MLTIHTPAKINRTLRVVRRRADGYHELDSEFLAVSLRDTLVLRPSAAAALRVDGPTAAGVPSDGSNLVQRVLADFGNRTGAAPLAVSLTKRIPNRAGLGGGSSDAAAALWGANELAGRPLGAGDLHAIAAAHGSDLNVFLAVLMQPCQRVRATGRGEIVRPLPDEAWHGVIAQPPWGLSTGAIFTAWGRTQRPTDAATGDAATGNAATGDAANDLQAAAESVSPDLQRWRLAIEAATGCRWTMSGSGSAYWTSVGDAAQAATVAARLTESQSDAAVFPVQAAGAEVVWPDDREIDELF